MQTRKSPRKNQKHPPNYYRIEGNHDRVEDNSQTLRAKPSTKKKSEVGYKRSWNKHKDSNKRESNAPAVKNCVWLQHLRKPFETTLPQPIKCSKPNCNNLIHHMCMIDWETSQGHEGPLQNVCPVHHDFFNEIGGGGGIWNTVPATSSCCWCETIHQEKKSGRI